MDLSSLLTGSLGAVITANLAKKLGIESTKAKWIISAGVPLLIAALNYNAKNKNQGANINNALKNHNGGILDNIGNLFSNESESDGNKIINHIFGKNTEMVTSELSQKSGLSGNQISSALAMLAPLVMGMLGKQKQSQGSDAGIGDLIGGLIGGGNNSGGGLLGSILGSVLGGGEKMTESGGGLMDSLANLASEFFKPGNNKQQTGNVLDSITDLFK